MTTTLTQTRPPHIPRDWWYRATWHARKRVLDTENKRRQNAQAEAERLRADKYRIGEIAKKAESRTLTPAELDAHALIEMVEVMIASDDGIDAILEATGRRVGALEALCRRNDRPDLARYFGNVRNAMRRTNCPDCGKPIWQGAAKCQSCANAATHKRNREDVIEDLEWMLGADSSMLIDEAAKRLGYETREGLRRLVSRAGRQDLLDVFARNAEAAGFNLNRHVA